MFRTVRMGYEFIGFPCMDSYAVCLKIQTDLVKLKGMGFFVLQDTKSFKRY
ncbi:MAG: hypothetical protein KAV87_22275 [Desulfobacteraceae bacterium]|nr:hypothetical protein [Desulfobacteraceae bacterium]